MKLNSRQLRYHRPTKEQMASIKRAPLYLILDNVWDTYNIGAIFRLADAVAAKKVIICGQSETPPNIKIHRAAIGTEEWVPWEYAATTEEAIKNLKLKIKNLTVYAIEQGHRSVAYDRVDYQFPAAFIVGNGSDGISSQVLSLADKVVEIPMWGFNKSLNVMVSLAIVLWQAVGRLQSE